MNHEEFFKAAMDVCIAFNKLPVEQKIPAVCMMIDDAALSNKMSSVEVLEEIAPIIRKVNEMMGSDGVII